MKDTLKLVVAVRHGMDSLGHLTEEGKSSVKKLAEKLRAIIPQNQRVVILSSHADRAKETAIIIQGHFDVNHIVCEKLYGDEYSYGKIQMEAVLSHSDGYEVVIVVTHYIAPSGITNAFANKWFQGKVHRFECNKGNGVMVFRDTGEIVLDILNHE